MHAIKNSKKNMVALLMSVFLNIKIFQITQKIVTIEIKIFMDIIKAKI